MKSTPFRSLLTLWTIATLSLSMLPVAKGQKPGTGKHEGKICEVTTYAMNTICKEWDGQWQGITVASDGNCYFGTSTHSSGHGAGFHVYNPKKKEHRVLAEDMTLVYA